MKPEIVIKEAFKIVGIKYEGKNENNEILSLWDELNGRLDEISYRTGQKVGYDTWTEKIQITGEFTYVAGVEVKGDPDVPQGMVSIKVPRSKYAVFTLETTLENVEQAVKDIFKKWLPRYQLEMAKPYDFEYYEEEFKPNDENSKLYFYVPIK